MAKFDTVFHGYDKKQVEKLVEEFTINYSSLLDALKEKDKAMSDLKSRLEYFEKIENTLNKAIFVAEDASSQIKRLAREESESMVENARRNADRIVNNALLKAEKIDVETEEIKRKVETYKRRLKSLIEEQLISIDNFDNGEF